MIVSTLSLYTAWFQILALRLNVLHNIQIARHTQSWSVFKYLENSRHLQKLTGPHRFDSPCFWKTEFRKGPLHLAWELRQFNTRSNFYVRSGTVSLLHWEHSERFELNLNNENIHHKHDNFHQVRAVVQILRGSPCTLSFPWFLDRNVASCKLYGSHSRPPRFCESWVRTFLWECLDVGNYQEIANTRCTFEGAQLWFLYIRPAVVRCDLRQGRAPTGWI